MEPTKQYSQKYVHSTSPIVATEPGYNTSFFLLDERVRERSADGQDWQRVGGLEQPAGPIYLAQGTDEVFTWLRPWTLTEGLADEELGFVPDVLRGEFGVLGGCYQPSTLGPGPFQFLEMEFTRDQLIAVLAVAAPSLIGVVEPLEDCEQQLIHPTGGSYEEWCSIFLMVNETPLWRDTETLRISLYRVLRGVSRYVWLAEPQLYIGFQGATGPEFLLEFGYAQRGWAHAWWDNESLKSVLTKKECKYHLAKEERPELPSTKSRKSALRTP